MAVSNSVVQLCLKFTESELKTFLSKLSEWRDYEINQKNKENLIMDLGSDLESKSQSQNNNVGIEWRKYSKGVCFYNLISSLAGRLKSIFLPSMVRIIVT